MTSTSIRELRDSTGKTQKEFASMFHIPLSTLRKWEQGSASPPDYVIRLIAGNLPYNDQRLQKIGKGETVFYYDPEAGILMDRSGNRIPVTADLSEVNPQNLILYCNELFSSYYEAVEKFEQDCSYDKEEGIVWYSEEYSPKN